MDRMSLSVNRRQLLINSLILLGSHTALANNRAVFDRAVTLRCSLSKPQGGQDPDGGWSGFEVDFSRALLNKDHPKHQLDILTTNWARAIKLMQSGQLDLLSAASWRPERTEFMDYLAPIDYERPVILTLESKNLKVDTLDDFMRDNQKFQLLQSGVYEPEFDRRRAEDPQFAAHFVNIPGVGKGNRLDIIAASLQRLRYGRVDGLIWGDLLAGNLVNKSAEVTAQGIDLDGLKMVVSPVFKMEPTYLCASKKGVPESVRISWRRAARELMLDAQFSEIWRNWYKLRALPGTDFGWDNVLPA